MEHWMDLILKCERDWRLHKMTCPQCLPGNANKRMGECHTRQVIKETGLQAALVVTGYMIEVQKARDILIKESW